MWDWLLLPIDAGRGHDVGSLVSWHARMMVLGWGVLAPLAVFVARFFKVTPNQNWPEQLDNQLWWRSHWMGQSLVLVLTVAGLVLVLPPNLAEMSLHRWLGYIVLALMGVQIALGLRRGSKGGPTSPAPDGSIRGDHYDMTPWRRKFEAMHKTIGYGVLILAALTILLGLWDVNGPRWIWIAIVTWWVALVCLFVILQKRGMAVDTYQAIWGTDPVHPGNQNSGSNWGMHRSSKQ